MVRPSSRGTQFDVFFSTDNRKSIKVSLSRHGTSAPQEYPLAHMMPLRIGHPSDDWATHTSLLVPFAYQLERAETIDLPNSHTAYWRVAPIVDEKVGSSPDITQCVTAWDRHKYFTADTANVLYQRSRRFVLEDPHFVDRYKFPTSHPDFPKREVEIACSRPELWLFEYEAAAQNGSPKTPDPMCCGILRQEFYFPRGAKKVESFPTEEPDNPSTIYLSDLLQLNEQLRFLRQGFSGDRSRSCQFGAASQDQEDETRIKYWANLMDLPLLINNQRRRFVDRTAIKSLREHWGNNGGNMGADQNSTVFVHDDDRAFVWTTAIINGETLPKPLRETPQECGAWVALMNVDRSAELHATKFACDWAERRTYRRWAHFGTYYGFTSHSGCMLSSADGPAPTWLHMRTTYLDQTMLLLYLRSVVHRFSNELVRQAARQRKQRITKTNRRNRDDAELRHAELLLSQLAEFINLYQFPLLSNQQQGVELYTMQRRELDIDELFREVQNETESTHRHLDVMRNRHQARLADRIQRIGVPFALLGLAATMLTIKAFEIESTWLTIALVTTPAIIGWKIIDILRD